MTYKTKGIILKRSNFGEADRILTIFSDRFGKIRALAKGTRKQSSKLAGNLEPFCLANFVLAEGRNFDIVTEAEIINCFFKMRNDLTSVNSTYYLAEVIDKMTEDRQVHEDLFNLFYKTLERINFLPEKIVLAYFEINLLSILGFQPELFKCQNCGQKISAGGNFFDFGEGGLRCKGCSQSGLKISDEAIKVLRLFLKHDIKLLTKLKLPEKISEEVIDITDRYLKNIHQQEFKSRRFLK